MPGHLARFHRIFILILFRWSSYTGAAPLAYSDAVPSIFCSEKKMKKPTLAHLIAIPLLTISSMAFAAEETPSEVMQLTETEMDDVTAGTRGGGRLRGLLASLKFASISQINISPVIVIQIGNNNSAIIFSGNFSSIFQ
jgi:hypothetical protein